MDLAHAPFCAETSSAREEPLGATASRLDHWILLEYRGAWSRDIVGGSLLSSPVKEHLRAALRALPHSRLLFVRRTERRGRAGRMLYLGSSTECDPRFCKLELESYDDLLSLDLAGSLLGHGPSLGAPVDDPLFVVCTHGKRDRCCAKFGQPVYEELCRLAGPEHVWQSTHVGGDRFAGNVVCFPHGLFYGRVRPDDVGTLLERHLDGQIDLDHFRGRSCFPLPVQEAERLVRAETGVSGIADLELVEVEQEGDELWRIRLAVGPAAEQYEVEVEREQAGAPAYLTCDAVREKTVRRFATRSYRALARR